jgi:hypothetical protein
MAFRKHSIRCGVSSHCSPLQTFPGDDPVFGSFAEVVGVQVGRRERRDATVAGFIFSASTGVDEALGVSRHNRSRAADAVGG